MMLGWLCFMIAALHVGNVQAMTPGSHSSSECWTKWFDRDNPSGKGDFEILSKLRREHPTSICQVPLQIDVETTSGGSVSSTSDKIHISDITTGFICKNAQQKKGWCSDYRVRFKCPLKFCPPVITECWTPWFDRDDPSGAGDFETLAHLSNKYKKQICDHPIHIEVQTRSGESLTSTGDVIYAADSTTGFICKNSNQKKGMCSDYRVRFLCPLDHCHPNVCFTKWFNRDRPSGKGDFEILSKLWPKYSKVLCKRPITLEVVTAKAEKLFALNGQIAYRYDTTEGFICRNKDQHGGSCYDYKVRFGCPCK
ncbi:cartilage intermediate layer protein 1-like [Nerophis lumbriciformis]|uniref:cartilage intermediate layer protein 1-like n=1 Tax=Nerophis lumbriciformis TaxID=546530 RepID=UPI002AE09929|nr:cartilage intermediate layer protein 1-like [Nerophis lumbriciformis]